MYKLKNIHSNIYHLLCVVFLINSCATQPYAPIEFKGNRLKNNTLKYYHHTTPSEVKSQSLDVESLNFIPIKEAPRKTPETNFAPKNRQKPYQQSLNYPQQNNQLNLPIDKQLNDLFKNSNQSTNSSAKPKPINADSSKNAKQNSIDTNIAQKKTNIYTASTRFHDAKI